MAENTSEKVETKTPNEIEELRKRRLAYFESTSSQSLQQQNEKGSAQNKQKLQSKTRDELPGSFETDKEKELENNDCGQIPRLDISKSTGGQNSGRYSKNSENVDTGYSREGKDEFRLITEKLQQKMSQGSGDGCDEEVENLIRLAKKEIAERYGNKNETVQGSGRVDAKGDNFYMDGHIQKDKTLPLQPKDAYSQTLKEKTAMHNVSDSAQKSLDYSKISEKSQKENHFQKNESKNPLLYRENIKPKKVEERNIEDLFSGRHPYSHNRQHDVFSSFKVRASDSHDFESVAAFQKSIDTEVIDDLGLSTHRAESERLDSNFSEVFNEKEIEEKLKQVSPRVFNEVTSDELRFALGEKKYKEFLEKSLRDIDELHSDRSTDKQTSSKEINKSKAYKGHKTAEREKNPKLLKSEKQKFKGVPSASDIKTKTHKHKEEEEKTTIHNEVESEFTKVTESFDDVSEIKLGKGETTNVETDLENNFGRPLLNRPKHEPKNIYTPKQQMSEKDKDTPNRNYEQMTVARNVVFSADEIYNQAYKGHVPVTPDHFSSVPSSPHIQGQGHMMNPLYHSINMGYGQQYIQQPPNPFVQNPTSVYGVPGQFNQPQYHAYAHHPGGPVDVGPALPHHVQAEMDRYVQQMSARSLQSFDGSEFQKFPQYYSPVVPHPPESKPSSSDMKSRPVQNVHLKNLHQFTHMEPHPPNSVPHSARTSQPSEFTNYLQQMPKGIPYPPPPENVDLSAYFQYLSSQGYPVPYPRMMPSYPPGQSYVQMTPAFNRMESAEMFVEDKTKGLETNGQIMIPHPPTQKRDESSPRRNCRLDITNNHDGKAALKQDVPVEEHDGRRDIKQDKPVEDQDSKNPSQRHIEGIRQFHEQKRLQQEEDEVLQKQRKFAKASIDRYFTSLENLYMRDHNRNFNDENVNNTESLSLQNESEMKGQHRDNDAETLVNTEFTSATSIKAGGVTEREEKLGIDLSFIKGEVQKNSKDNLDSGNKSSGKLVIVCPECGEVNKPYMSWCADCGDVLIGINPILMKKGKNGKLKRCVTQNQNVEIENIKNVTFVEKEIEGDPGIVPQIVSERDDVISPVHDEVYKGKTSPNKSDSRDSGRPSSEDMDYGRTEKEVTEICENISDPVIKGFIKAYFNRKKQAVNMKEGKDNSTGDEEENDVDQNTDTGKQNDSDNVSPQNDVQNQIDSHRTQNVDHAYSHPRVQEYVQVHAHSNAPDFVHVDTNSHPQEIQTQNKYDVSAVEPPVSSKTKPSYSKKKPKLKKTVPVDIEVFPSCERRSSGRSEPIVPILNLVNSSDEEDDINEQRNRQLLDSSTETNDFNEFFDPAEESENLADFQDAEDNGEQPFLAQVISDINKTSKPKRPDSGNGRGKRPGNNNAKSVVRESIESAGYQRHWERSSIAWGSYNQRELSTKSSIRSQSARGRPSSASRNRFVRGSSENLPEEVSGTSSERKPVPKKKQLNNRPASADTRRPRTSANSSKSNRRSSDSVNVYESVNVTNAESPKIQVNSPSEVDTVPDIPGIVDHRLPVEQVEDIQTKIVPTSSTVVTAATNDRNFMKLQEMTPRIRDGELSMWLCFPDEIFLHILSFLSQSDLARCAQVCKTFYRLAMDLSLWKYITVKKKRNLDDDSLVLIGKRHPVSLALIQCHGENITARGLRELFRECAEYLRELNFSGCSRGALTGDCILLHASARCRNITHVDASWCNVTDSGIGAISESCNRLESLCINGCQMISDEGLETVIKKHGKSLRVLEMFGCFNITPKGIRYLGNHCINLITLNLGQCYKMTDSCITQLSHSLGKVETLDLRGCKNIKDNCMRYVVKNCPRLKTIVLANCPNISDVSVLEISTYTTDIRNIDVCGCRKITDSGIRALANNCQNLRYIDISSSGCTHRSVSMLANFCSQRLETIKLNFLSDVTETVLIKLAKHCKRLKLLHLYGCTSVRLTDKIREVNPNLVVEM